MRILFVITELSPAGAEKIVSTLACSYRNSGDVCMVLALMPPPEKNFTSIVEKLEANAINVKFLSGRGSLKYILPLIHGIRKTVKEFAPDVIHAHLIHPSILTRLACLFHKIPLVNTIHIAEKRKGKGVFFLLDHLTFFRCDAYTAVSEAAASFQEKMSRLPEKSVKVICNGSDSIVKADEETLQQYKKKWHLEDLTFLAGAAGRLDYQKGYDLFLESIPAIAQKIPQGEKYGFLFMGEGPYGERLRKRAEELNRKYRNIKILFPGFEKNASSLLPLLDLFLMPSRYEGYGLALVEAFSLGIPSLSSKVDSLPEICRHYEGHFLYCDPENTSETAEKFFEAVSLKKFEGKIISSSKEMCDSYKKLYHELLQKKG